VSLAGRGFGSIAAEDVKLPDYPSTQPVRPAPSVTQSRS
jgi:hypothetical protein